ncbi:hypothetical protein C4561_04350 [candidate division WWE3 bacterium]|uniref:Uncharacterized protein n=1 Tax=candidate division WWE3 bacterium TaxID=2053526 RepID=A0A3A4ZD11_UNCKA|nr:MAG: hypothetical protein C4561_04350 [candidate division WWE3 bacterium]
MKYGKYWMIQWQINNWVSFGIHVDWSRKYTGRDHIPYGPYVDIHFLFFIFSFGYNPKYSNEAELLAIGRGGIDADNDN